MVMSKELSPYERERCDALLTVVGLDPNECVGYLDPSAPNMRLLVAAPIGILIMGPGTSGFDGPALALDRLLTWSDLEPQIVAARSSKIGDEQPVVELELAFTPAADIMIRRANSTRQDDPERADRLAFLTACVAHGVMARDR